MYCLMYIPCVELPTAECRTPSFSLSCLFFTLPQTCCLLWQCKKCSNLRSQPCERCPLLPWLWRCLTNETQSISCQLAAWQEMLGCHSESLIQQKCPRLSPSAQILAVKAKSKACPNVSGYVGMPQRVGGTPVADEIDSEGSLGKGKTHQFLPCLENTPCQK